MLETSPRFTWDGSQEDFRLRKLGFLASINDVTHHGKLTAAAELQNTRCHQGTQSQKHSIFLLK